MNKPAAKEPSMDEILSSIRQIIADDDAAPVSAAPKPVDTPAMDVSDELPSFAAFDTEDDSEDGALPDFPTADDALALSEEQIVPEEESEDLTSGMVMPDDIAFSAAGDDEIEEIPEPVRAAPRVSVSDAAPMPDTSLSGDLAESLLQPATQAAVRHTMSRLGGNVPLGGEGVTIENMIREMLRPMLKEWLDENLPSMVESIVEKEIERVSRGGR